MQRTTEVAEYKISTGTQVLDKQREAQKLEGTHSIFINQYHRKNIIPFRYCNGLRILLWGRRWLGTAPAQGWKYQAPVEIEPGQEIQIRAAACNSYGFYSDEAEAHYQNAPLLAKFRRVRNIFSKQFLYLRLICLLIKGANTFIGFAAAACNSYGFYSDEAEAHYQVELQKPETPRVTPGGGYFNSPRSK